MTIPQTTENEDLPLVNGVNGDNIKIMSRNSEHIENDDKKKEKRQSSLLMRRNTSRNISTKSVDLALSPSTPKKEEFNKLKNTAQNLSYKMFLMNHYVAWEINGSKQILNNFKKNSQIKVLISNISTPSAAFLVRNAKKKTQGLSIYCETSVPYLFFHSNMIRAGECKFKGSPPIRDNENRNLLIVGLNVKDLFHCVSSFHMQVPTEYKKIDKGNFKRCFNGFSIIGFNLQVVWTKLYGPLKIKFEKQPNEPVLKEKINHTMKNIIKLMCENPAEMLGLNQKKGKIKEGFDADFVVWNPFKIEEIKDDMIHLKYKKIFLLRNYKVFGKVENTFLRGKCVFSRKQGGQSVFEKKGEIIFRK
jgi:allantoinase